jgi:hypothetical protein
MHLRLGLDIDVDAELDALYALYVHCSSVASALTSGTSSGSLELGPQLHHTGSIASHTAQLLRFVLRRLGGLAGAEVLF